ncbi:hypothetical protein AB3G45_29355 [Shinella sp. S4-D37]|jgi:hypothetical protein|nr:hypothetical protein [Shinella sp.]
MQSDDTRKTPPFVIALAWAFVGIPLLAGISQTLLNAAKLFQ